MDAGDRDRSATGESHKQPFQLTCMPMCVCVRVCAQPLTSNTKRRLKIPASRETSVLLRPAGRETERSENQHKHPRAVGARQPALRRNPRCRIESISTITDNAKTPKAL